MTANRKDCFIDLYNFDVFMLLCFPNRERTCPVNLPPGINILGLPKQIRFSKQFNREACYHKVIMFVVLRIPVEIPCHTRFISVYTVSKLMCILLAKWCVGIGDPPLGL